MIAILGDEPEPDLTPHPDLVAAQRPSPREVAEAAALIGWLPDIPYLNPAVPFRREGE